MTPAGAGSGRPPGRCLPAAVALALVLAVSGCEGGGGDGAAGDGDGGPAGTIAAGGGPVPTFPGGPATATVPVVLRDFAFTGIPATVAGPNVLFEAKVRGSNAHELVVLDAAGTEVEALSPFRAGTTKRLAVVLAPGPYSAVCLVREGARTHADLGMRAAFTVS